MYKCFNILIIYLINLWYNLSQNLNFQKYFFEGDKSSHYVENVFSQYPIVTPSYCRILFVKTFIFFPDFYLFFNIRNFCQGRFYFGSLLLNFSTSFFSIIYCCWCSTYCQKPFDFSNASRFLGKLEFAKILSFSSWLYRYLYIYRRIYIIFFIRKINLADESIIIINFFFNKMWNLDKHMK